VWLEVRVDCTNEQAGVTHSVSLEQPLCCQKGWAVACLHLALRKKLKTHLGNRAQFLRADQKLRSLLYDHLPPPEAADYWELVRELSVERKAKREQKRSASRRRQAAEAFVSLKRNADCRHDNIADLPVSF